MGEKTDKAMGRVGNWLGGCLTFPFDWKAFPAKRLLIGASVVLLALWFVGFAWGEGLSTTLAAVGLTLAVGLSVEAIGAVATAAAPSIAAISQGIAGAVAVGGGIGAVNIAGLTVVSILGIVGIAVLAGVVIAVVVPALVSRSGAGQSGEMTGDMAAANQAANEAANAEAAAAAILSAVMASFPPPPIPPPMVRFSTTPTGELTVTVNGTDAGAIDTGQGATPNTGIPGESPSGFTGLTHVDLEPATVTPGPSDLPGIGESVPGSEPDASINASVEGGEYGWVDGVCRHYATGLSCAEYQEHEEEEYRHHAVAWPSTWWVLLTGLAWPFYRRIAR